MTQTHRPIRKDISLSLSYINLCYSSVCYRAFLFIIGFGEFKCFTHSFCDVFTNGRCNLILLFKAFLCLVVVTVTDIKSTRFAFWMREQSGVALKYQLK